jgi:hypothetical protein
MTTKVLPSQARTSVDSLKLGEQEVDSKLVLSGAADQAGFFELTAHDGLRSSVQVSEGATAQEIARQLKASIDPGPFAVDVEEFDDGSVSIQVRADDAEALAAKKAEVEDLHQRWAGARFQKVLVPTADPQLDSNQCVIWSMGDGRSFGVIAPDGAIYVQRYGGLGRSADSWFRPQDA